MFNSIKNFIKFIDLDHHIIPKIKEVVFLFSSIGYFHSSLGVVSNISRSSSVGSNFVTTL